MSHFTIWHHMVKLGFSDLASFFFLFLYHFGAGFFPVVFFTCFHVGLGASPRHNLPAALILEDDFDLQPDFAPLASQSGEEA